MTPQNDNMNPRRFVDGLFHRYADGDSFVERNMTGARLFLVRRDDSAVLAFIQDGSPEAKDRLARLAAALEDYPGQRLAIQRR